MMKRPCQRMAETWEHDDTMPLTLLLHNLLVYLPQFPLTNAAILIDEVVGVSNKTVGEWRSQFVLNEG